MKKRILCFVLTLIMLVSLVPVSALTADAASNAISETAIYVLKQLEGYQKTCENGYIGYGAKCPKCLGKTGVNADVNCGYVMYEKDADKLLREELKELDKAVNKFADKNGLSLTKSQHDALVMFSFQNGSAWTLGTGELQTAIKSGYTGSKFLDAICKWNYSESDDNRRRVEANMYLNGVYSSAAPGYFICVHMDPTDAGFLSQDNENHLHYFDVASPVTITMTPSPKDKNNSFLGWYVENEDGTYTRVTALTSSLHGETLVARYQNDEEKAGESYSDIQYTVKKSGLASTTVYNAPNGTKVTTYINEVNKEVTIKLPEVLYVVNDYVDANGNRWAQIAELVKNAADEEVLNVFGWVKVKGNGSSTTNGGSGLDVTVTVTNTYVNMRKNASITSTKNGSFNLGTTLRIIDTKNSDGFLWGQVATSANDETPIGWVALMYTDYDSVIANNTVAAPEVSVATATIVSPVNGYVNVRSAAGINNQIVGALSYGITVDLYEVKYVNGIRWGRTDTGWFCLTYANVSGLDSNTGTGEAGFTNYIYVATLTGWNKNSTINEFDFFDAPNGNEIEKYEMDSKGEYVLDKNGNKIPVKIPSDQIKIGSLRALDNGSETETWAYTPYGWMLLATHDEEATDLPMDNVGTYDLTWDKNPAKYYAISDDVTVRLAPRTDAKREDVMIKGTEFNVTRIVMFGESIWGYALKVGENNRTYEGWVNLSNQNVSRNANGDYHIESGSTAATTVKMARVVGTDSLRVRNTGATYGTVIGSLSMGTTAKVLDEKNGWYLLDIDVDNNPSTGSWVSGSYLEIFDETVGGTTTGTTSTGAVETGLGMVANTYTGVNIRSGAGTAYAATGKYLTGTTVEILEVKTVGASKWGRTEKGWVCMDYIVMVDSYLIGAIGGNTGNGGNTTTSSNIVIYTGKTTEDVIVYKNMNTATDGNGGTIPVADAVRELSAGQPVTVHELICQVEYDEPDEDMTEDQNDGKNEYIVKRTSYWARVNEGYIYAPGNCIELDTLDEHAYTVSVAKATVYEDWDMSAKKDYTLAKGAKLYITQLHIKNNHVMCFYEHADSNKEGWIKLADLDKGFASSTEPEVQETVPPAVQPTTPSTVVGSTGNTGGSVSATGYKYTGKVINTNQVNVRATASTTAAVTTTLKSGAALVIYETVISEYMAWGRCDAGWVYLYYVDLTPVGSGAVDARVVYQDNTIIYQDMGMTQATGSTYAKMAVVDIYEIVGKMARTELGWIHMDNLL